MALSTSQPTCDKNDNREDTLDITFPSRFRFFDQDSRIPTRTIDYSENGVDFFEIVQKCGCTSSSLFLPYFHLLFPNYEFVLGAYCVKNYIGLLNDIE
ncbi:hypothetical protein B9Z55_013117 [Caenorhabditis nigoni]|uniref:Uncharacterized protein n=1 Tax=Caenorhabditis nigoni TaxID=1611254 RepID=A0A2G5U0F6_9PELO|nr:hypothetical protein B9Z55_013117 [Caenorhabditis nigoni]